MELQIKAVSPKIGRELPLPQFATDGAAAMDLCACVDAPVVIPAGTRTVIPSGIAIALPGPEYVALLFSRSGMGIKSGISLSNSVGVIDSEYRGEIGVGLLNTSDVDYIVHPGDRIAQLMITPVVCPTVKLVEELPASERGAGGFGSTGR